MKFSQFSFLIQSILLMLLLGSVYAWGVFRVEAEIAYQISASLSGLPYMVSLVSYAGAMLIAGQYMSKYRKLIVFLGVFLFVTGFWLSSIVDEFNWLILTYGVFLGGGVGLLYGVPIYLVQRLFDKRIGLYSGLILMGFGLSNTIMTPIIVTLLSQQTIQETMRILGWISLGVFLLSLWPLLQTVPNEPKTKQTETSDIQTYDHASFRSLYVVYVLSLLSGLTIVGLSYPIGITNYQFDATFVTVSISIFSLLNGLSRPFFGGLVDRFGFFKVAFFSLFSLILSGLISLLNAGVNPTLYAISFGAFWFGLGNWMALMPLSIKTMFPKALFASLYGKLFTAYGLAAILGTVFSGAILDLMNSTWPIYLMILIANFTNLFLVLWLKNRFHFRIFK
jgi:MFS family permease